MLKDIDGLMNKVFVREFYRLHAGFFLVVLGLAFGFMSGIEHKALAEFFMSTPQTACIPVALWMLYAWKIMVFNKQVMKKRGSEFLFQFSFLTNTTQWLQAVQLFFIQLLPAIAYGIFLMAIAWKISEPLNLLVVIVGLVVLCIAGAAILRYGLNHPDEEQKVTRLKMWIDNLIVRQYPQFFLEWMARRSFVTVVGTKVFACLLITTTAYLYIEEYDWRLFGMGLTVAFASQTLIIFYYHRFENFYFQLLRNLPFSVMKRLLLFLSTMMLIGLPELALLIGKFPGHLDAYNLVLSVLYGISLWILIYGFMYRADIGMERLIQRVFAWSLSYVVLVLFGVPPLVLIIVNTTLGWMLLTRYYYTFEFEASVESEK